VEDQDGRAADGDRSADPRGGPPRGRLQHLPAALGRRLHRPPDGLRHLGHERPAMGRDDARRRVLRREPQLLPHGGGGPALLRLRPRRAHSPRPRGRAPDQPGAHQAGRPRARQYVLHDHPLAPGTGRRHVPRRDHRRGPRPGVAPSVQGQRGHGEVARGRRKGRRGEDPLRVARRHGQHGRRPACLHGQRTRTPPVLRRARHQGPARRDAHGRELALHHRSARTATRTTRSRRSCSSSALTRTAPG
jgi:hypothetical protein